ncbi:MAG: winged helix-turn-helix transcriptional regulator [Sphingomonadaceae bacterium]|nr:winged helix-turn-helix transcriptional regulator [Sphingomonadaceae bacterium]
MKVDLVVTHSWRVRYADILIADGIETRFHADGDALAGALAQSWEPVDAIILDLALTTPALVPRLAAGPRLLAFGDPEFAGVALAAGADFLPDEIGEAALLVAIHEVEAEGGQLADVSGHRPFARPLSAEATRIADALARLEAVAGEVPAIDPVRVRQAIRARRARDRYFPAELFAEPAWDMLLDLAAAAAEGVNVAVSSLCIAAAVPTTTALRWIRTLCEVGLFERRDDPHDARRAFIRLSPPALEAMARYLAQTTQPWL